MPRTLTDVPLDPGTVYRTAWLRRWGDNPTRLAHKLERRGLVQRLGHGLFYAPRKSRFGDVPPSDEALLDAFLDGTPYVVTGPHRWNALGLGSTALFARPLVYNTKRTGTFCLIPGTGPDCVSAPFTGGDGEKLHSGVSQAERELAAGHARSACPIRALEPARTV